MSLATPYPRIISHRCGGALAPENSLEGLRIAARLGCRGVEFDVMLSKDGVPLLFHDETLERTTNGHGSIADLTAEEIRCFDAGGPHHRAFAVSPAPTFAEAMACCEALGLWTNIELKPATGHEAITGTIVGRWLAAHWNGNGIISSFSETALRTAREEVPAAAFALLLDALTDDWEAQMARTGAHALHLANHSLEQDETCWQEVVSAGVPLAVYTVNHRARAARLFSAGACAIFTDRPDLWLPEEM